MSQSVNLPALGESVTEGTVTRWLKKVGDRVEVDEPLLEVSTDKVDTEIPSPIAGVIEAILVAEDETVEVGTPLVTIGDGSGSDAPAAPASTEAAPVEAAPEAAPPAPEDDAQPEPLAPPAEEAAAEPVAEVPSTDAPEPEAATDSSPVPPAPAEDAEPAPAEAVTPAPAEAAPAAAPAPAPAAPTTAPDASAASGNAAYVTPIVRKLANDKGIDLASVTGTGVGGRIRKQDVIAAGTTISKTAPAPAEQREPLATSPLRGTIVPMSRLRKVISDRAVISMQTSAQLTSVVEVDVTRVAHFRDDVKEQFERSTGVKLSFLPFFALAAAEALRAYPIVNANIDGDNIVYPDHENISVAVDTERGLLTPVIRDAGNLNLAGFATQIADLASRTRENKLKPDELAGGTFTLTNTGSRGALFDTPIVFLPQSAILGTGIVVKRPVVVSDNGLDAIAIRSMVYLALSYDHRIVDGADAARFLVAVKDRLENGGFEGNLGI
ncbi:MAG TPA: 2-oxoglutarate dehydrogenase, E2 component, dihydrolipoamide succinyltransferase [Galbitalea sp.]|jgi:2-oxoglutarate dehydrogenase E2 component (dihydrolipoamide succinyltransferase)|nr:2-oxoglutarate dehydrogenase, E2 component, dihydrolipoamide succinyltransferase [Galbitalea sp.]